MLSVSESHYWRKRAGDNDVLRQKSSNTSFNFYFSVVSVKDPKQIAKSTMVGNRSVPEIIYDYHSLSIVAIPPFYSASHMTEVVGSSQLLSKELSCPTFSRASRSIYPVYFNRSVKVSVTPFKGVIVKYDVTSADRNVWFSQYKFLVTLVSFKSIKDICSGTPMPPARF